MADVIGPRVHMQFTDFLPDPHDADVMRRAIEVEADVMTFEDGMVTLWLQGTEVAAFPLHLLKAARLHPATAAPPPDSRAYTVSGIRKQHGNAYQRWSEEDDQRLLQLHASGHDIDILAENFSRQPSAIHARLEKLGAHQPGSPQQPATPPF
ncbi:hypothetical protein [Streptomyces sp. NPDC048603]|uniref:hypothetical protein n=1 Tax=Streptomyces sp. NPDC048603 TaxID=3365577 RepID=UPI003717111B